MAFRLSCFFKKKIWPCSLWKCQNSFLKKSVETRNNYEIKWEIVVSTPLPIRSLARLQRTGSKWFSFSETFKNWNSQSWNFYFGQSLVSHNFFVSSLMKNLWVSELKTRFYFSCVVTKLIRISDRTIADKFTSWFYFLLIELVLGH